MKGPPMTISLPLLLLGRRRRSTLTLPTDRSQCARPRRPAPLRRPPLSLLDWADSGAVTAEYAVATLAAVGFAGVLVVVLRSDEVRALLVDLVRGALTGG